MSLVLSSQVWNISMPTKLPLISLLGDHMISGTAFVSSLAPSNQPKWALSSTNSLKLTTHICPWERFKRFNMAGKTHPALHVTLTLASVNPFRFNLTTPFHVHHNQLLLVSQSCHDLGLTACNIFVTFSLLPSFEISAQMSLLTTHTDKVRCTL